MADTTNDAGRVQKLIKGSVLIFLGNVLGAGAGFFLRFITARHLGASDYGVVILGFVTLNVATIFVLMGLPEGLGRYLSRVDNPSKTFYGAIALTVPLSCLLTAILYTFAPGVAAVLNEPKLTPVLRLFIISLPFVVVVKIAIGGFRGSKDAIGRVVVQNLLYQCFTAGVVFGGVIFSVGVTGIVGGWTLSYILTGISAILILFSRTKLLDQLRSVSLADINPVSEQGTKQILFFSLPLLASEGLWMLVTQSDSFLIAFFMESQDVGVYDAAFTVARLVMLVTGTVSFLFLPLLSELHEENNIQKMSGVYKMSAKWMSLFVLPGIVVFIAIPDTLLRVIFGPEFGTGGVVLVILSLGFYVNVIMGLNQDGIMAIGQPQLILRANIFAFFLNISLNILLIPVLGVIGAAIASALSFASTNLYWSYLLYDRVGIQPFTRPMVNSLLSSGLVAAAVLLVGHVFGASTLQWFLLLAGYFLLHCLLVFVLVDLEPEMKQILTNALN